MSILKLNFRFNSSSTRTRKVYGVYPPPPRKGALITNTSTKKNKKLTLVLVHVNIKASFQDDKDFPMLVLGSWG